MSYKTPRWITVVGAVTAFLLLVAVVCASAPPSPLAGPSQAGGIDADTINGHGAAYSGAKAGPRANKVLWTTSSGKFAWNALPNNFLDGRYVNDDRADTMTASVANGPVLKVENTYVSGGGYAIQAINASDNTWRPAIYGENTGNSAGVYGRADGWHATVGWTASTDSGIAGVMGHNAGSGPGVRAEAVSGNIIEAYSATDREFYVSQTGEVYADGTFHNTGADLAEMLPATDGLEPGDVLVVGSDGKLRRSTISNSTDVAGVYSTQPGFVGASGDESDLTGMVPLGIAGVVPVKVSAENGAIQPGDLLATSSTPGHAMKASPVTVDGVTFYLPGTILGKALEPLEAGTGVMQVLLTLE
jgi:hypothetical protein